MHRSALSERSSNRNCVRATAYDRKYIMREYARVKDGSLIGDNSPGHGRIYNLLRRNLKRSKIDKATRLGASSPFCVKSVARQCALMR